MRRTVAVVACVLALTGASTHGSRGRHSPKVLEPSASARGARIGTKKAATTTTGTKKKKKRRKKTAATTTKGPKTQAPPEDHRRKDGAMYNSLSTVEMKDGVPFLFWNPLSKTAAIVCLSQKAGSTTWKLVLLRAARREVDRPYSVFSSSPHLARRPKPPRDCPLWAGPRPRSSAPVSTLTSRCTRRGARFWS